MFKVDPAFKALSEQIAEAPLCQVRLQRDARFPWLILIPRRPGVVEIEDLVDVHRARLLDEIILAGGAVRAMGEAMGRPVTKLNVAALGNVISQLHVHVVGRRPDDDVWPGPVWGTGPVIPYSDEDLIRVRRAATAVLWKG